MLETRKGLKISQEELAQKLGIHAPLIGRYEREEVKPSIEVATNIANALNISLDYLVGSMNLELDKNILDKIIDIQTLAPEDKEHILITIDALLRDAKARQTYG